jgi:hypothetical protein
MSDKKVILATWVGGSAELIIDGVTLPRGAQQLVSAATAKRLEKEYRAQAVIVHTTEGSKDDVRVEPFVVPVQPDDPDAEVVVYEPAPDPDQLASPLREIDQPDQLDSTPLDNPEVKE